jgi:hypothetical protein
VNSYVNAEGRSVFFLTLLGPFSTLLTLSLFLLATPAQFYYIPLSLILGSAATWIFRSSGFAFSVSFLSVFVIYHLLNHTMGLWFIGATVSTVLSFMITWLTVDEADRLVGTFRSEAVEAHNIRDDVELKLAQYEERHAKEKESFQQHVSVLEKELSFRTSSLESIENIQELSRVELLSMTTKYEETQRLAADLQAAYGKLEEKVEDQIVLIDILKEKAARQDKMADELYQLKVEIVEKETEKQAVIDEMNEHLETLTREKDLLENTLSKLQGELEQREKTIHQLKEKPPEEPALPQDIVEPREYRRLFGMYKQLRDQFDEKQLHLDQARKDLFYAQENLSLTEKAKEEWEFKEHPSIKVLTRDIEELTRKNEEARREISNLEDLISSLMQGE